MCKPIRQILKDAHRSYQINRIPDPVPYTVTRSLTGALQGAWYDLTATPYKLYRDCVGERRCPGCGTTPQAQPTIDHLGAVLVGYRTVSHAADCPWVAWLDKPPMSDRIAYAVAGLCPDPVARYSRTLAADPRFDQPTGWRKPVAAVLYSLPWV